MDLFPMTTKITGQLGRPVIPMADGLFAASRVDPFARLREFPFPTLRQLSRIGDALAGYRLDAKHGEPK